MKPAYDLGTAAIQLQIFFTSLYTQHQRHSMWAQQKISLKPHPRGVYLITDEVVNALPQLKNYKVGILHLFIQHTSAALSLNENYDSDVPADMNDALNSLIPDDHDGRFRHSAAGEGPDDMAGHVKSSLIGASLTIPICNGRLSTGTWQGIYLMEFRDYKHQRNIVATIQGETK